MEKEIERDSNSLGSATHALRAVARQKSPLLANAVPRFVPPARACLCESGQKLGLAYPFYATSFVRHLICLSRCNSSGSRRGCFGGPTRRPSTLFDSLSEGVSLVSAVLCGTVKKRILRPRIWLTRTFGSSGRTDTFGVSYMRKVGDAPSTRPATGAMKVSSLRLRPRGTAPALALIVRQMPALAALQNQ
ncbi:hypothetical protein ABH945_005432 [Paraburkholderia sp. GAS333]